MESKTVETLKSLLLRGHPEFWDLLRILSGTARDFDEVFLLASLRRSPKNVLILNLNNALWGGVVAEDGLTGIELGDISPRREAFKAFQKYKSGDTMDIDTWLMSCRVLKRQVEEEVLNELARLAASRGCVRLKGVYLPTAKNEMVRDFYIRMGFALTSENENRREFELVMGKFQPVSTKIKIIRRAYESS